MSLLFKVDRYGSYLFTGSLWHRFSEHFKEGLSMARRSITWIMNQQRNSQHSCTAVWYASELCVLSTFPYSTHWNQGFEGQRLGSETLKSLCWESLMFPSLIVNDLITKTPLGKKKQPTNIKKQQQKNNLPLRAKLKAFWSLSFVMIHHLLPQISSGDFTTV